MSNKVDKLFKEKLEGHSLQPSAQAWEKVEAHLGKKNKVVLWARVAAAVGAVGLLTFSMLNWNGGDEKSIGKELGVRSQELGEKEQKSETAPIAVEKPKKIRKQNTQPKIVTPMIEQPQEKQIAVVPEPEVVPENRIESVPDLTTHNPHPTTQKGITLTYSLPAVKKQETPAEPLVAEEKAEPKKTGFNRVMEIAAEVKSGEALGELRQAKDDIFALDFRKDKNKKQ